MHFEITKLDSGVTKVVLAGRMDMEGSVKLENPFTFQLATQKAAIVVDMSGVDFIASIGIRLVIRTAKAQLNRGGKLVIFTPPNLVREALTMAGVDQLVPMHTDFEAACKDVSQCLAA